MKANGRAPVWSRLALPDLLAGVAVFGAASWISSGVAGMAAYGAWLHQWKTPVGLAGATFWLSTLYAEGRAGRGVVASARIFLTACGALFIVQAAVLYFFGIQPVPPAPTLLSTAALVAVSAIRKRQQGARGGVLFLGFDEPAGQIARSMGPGLIGILHRNASEVPPDLPYLGGPDRLCEIAATLRPARIVVGGTSGEEFPVAPSLLLDLRLSGVAIDDGMASYAEVFGRVLSRGIEGSPLRQSLRRLGSRPFVMSVQAVYTNLAGLALLVFSLPLLLPASLAVALFSGRGPVWERVECLGFQGIPFFMLRFRTRGAGGRPTSIGRLLGRLRLVNLPQLINVIRGEMAFIGPPPVRKEFGVRLGQLMAFYPVRFTVKPGMLGWSQVRLRDAAYPADESLRLEYDLYYVQEVVPALDVEILIRSIFRRPLPRRDTSATRVLP